MTAAPSIYAKARADVASMLRYDSDNLSAEQATRLDIATALRVLLDNQTGKLLRGESLDARELLMASDALAKILPSLAEPPSESHPDPRLEMWRIYSEMRARGEIGRPDDRVAELEAEIASLKAQLTDAGLAPALPDANSSDRRTNLAIDPAIDPPLSDIALPGEHGVKPRVGIERGPDDPPKPRVIDGEANPPAARPPQSWDETDNGKAWRAWVDAGGGVGRDPWANNQ
jgi:hypothetical protein